jgi:RNA polymerase sigma-70 factor (family 1)
MHKLTLKQYNNVFKKQYSALCLFSNKYIDNLEISKDIVQEVFIKIWEDQIEFQDDNTIKSYLYTSVKNKSFNYVKSKEFKSTGPLPVKDIAELENDPFYFRELAIAETSSLIEKAVSTLPAKCALIIRLSLEGLSNAEIAEELGLAVNTIKAQKKIAYKRLKPLLKESFILIAFIFEINN